MFENVKPLTWEAEGIVEEKRPLTTNKDGQERTWAYCIKLVTFGATFELQTRDPKVFDSCPEVGSHVAAVGTIEVAKGRVNLIVKRIAPPVRIASASASQAQAATPARKAG